MLVKKVTVFSRLLWYIHFLAETVIARQKASLIYRTRNWIKVIALKTLTHITCFLNTPKWIKIPYLPRFFWKSEVLIYSKETILVKPIKDNLHLNCLSMKNPSPISPSKPPGQVLYPARFKYKSSLSTNLFPVIKPKLAQMQSNSTDFTISNLAKFDDWQQNLKLPSSQIASLSNRV